jgi:DNA polymerase-3 subunit gamma/tau
MLAHFPRFEDVVDLIGLHRDAVLKVDVEDGVRLASYSPGRIEFTPSQKALRDLAARLSQRLHLWTGVRWVVTLVNDCEAPTIAETRDSALLELKAKAQEHPLVQAVITAFPGAKINEIRTPDEIEAEAAAEALQEVEDEWDPFEEE